jgi:hypothetical protein
MKTKITINQIFLKVKDVFYEERAYYDLQTRIAKYKFIIVFNFINRQEFLTCTQKYKSIENGIYFKNTSFQESFLFFAYYDIKR